MKPRARRLQGRSIPVVVFVGALRCEVSARDPFREAAAAYRDAKRVIESSSQGRVSLSEGK